MLTTHNVPYALQHIRYVLKQQICRLSRFSQPGKLKEKRASWVRETSPMSCNRKRLAGKSSAEQVKLGQLLRFSVSDIFAVPLSLRVKQCAVAALSVSVQLAVSHAYKTSGSCQSLPETANAGEHIEKTDGFPFTLPSRCIFGNAHQRMGHPPLNEKSPGRR